MCTTPKGGPPADHQNPYANIKDDEDANNIQIGGTHYQDDALTCPRCGHKMQHWDMAWLLKWDNFQYSVTKYLFRWRRKNGLQDLNKALHHMQKYVQMVAADFMRGGSAGKDASPRQDVTPAARGGLDRKGPG